MRVTRESLLDLAMRSTTRQYTELLRVQSQATSGIKFQRASEAPVDAARAERASEGVNDQEVYVANSEYAMDMANAADGVLESVQDIIVRAREIAVGMASDTMDAEARTVAATEVNSLRVRLQQSANADFDGRYLFAGDAWETEPFALDGTYSGSTAEPTTVVGASTEVRTAFDGSAIFNGSPDIFASLEALETALVANDATAVQASLGDLADSTDFLSSARAALAVDANTAEASMVAAETAGLVASDRLNDLIATDPIETYSRMTELQSGYERTLQVIASTSTRSLIDLLGS